MTVREREEEEAETARPGPTRRRATGAHAKSIVRSLTVRSQGAADLWDTPPTTVRQILAHTAAGDWVPGERSPWLELAGKAYGYGVAVPVTAGLYLAAWLVQRPARALAALVVLAVLAVTW